MMTRIYVYILMVLGVVVPVHACGIDNLTGTDNPILRSPDEAYWWIYTIDQNGNSLPFYAPKVSDGIGGYKPLKDGDSAWFGNPPAIGNGLLSGIKGKSVTIPAQFSYNDVSLNVVGYGTGWIESVEDIYVDAPIEIANCFMPNLINYHISDNNPYNQDIDGVLYAKDEMRLLKVPGGRLGQFTVPAKTEIIGTGNQWCGQPFGDAKITDVVFEDGSALKTICSYAFDREYPGDFPSDLENGKVHIQSIILPKSVNDITIEPNAFYFSKIKYIFLSTSVKHLGEQSLYTNHQYTSPLAITVEVESEDPSSFVIDGDPFADAKYVTLVVPDGCKEKYMAAEYWKDCGNIIEHTDYVGVDRVDATAQMYVRNRELHLSELPQCSNIAVYNIDGRLITDTTCSSEFTYSFDSPGIYLVSVNKNIKKILVK